MNKPMITIHDLVTDEVIVREMNDEEFAIYMEQKEIFDNQQKAIEEAKIAKADLLAKLGITEDEAKLLLS